MTPTDRPVSEDDLHAYVDGFLPPSERARVELYLADHPEAAARIRGWQDSQAILRRALAGKAAEPVPSALNLARLAERRRSSAWAPRQAAASVVFALVVGSGFGWWARGSDVPHGLTALGQQAAVAQRVFAANTSHPEFGANALEQRVGWTGQAPGRQIMAPDLSQMGYKLIGSRAVATEQGAAPMFLYENARGDRISVFVRLMLGIDENAAMRPLDADGVSGFAWSHNGVGFGLVADKPAATLRDLSDHVRSEMDART